MPKPHNLKILLFIFFVSSFLIFYWGHFYTSDEMLMAMTAKSIVDSHSLTFPEIYGKTSSRYGIAVPILAIPFYMIDKIVWNFIPEAGDDILFFNLLNVFTTAALGLMIYLLSMKIYRNEKISAILSLITILTSDFLPNSRTLLSEPLFTLVLITAFYFIVKGENLTDMQVDSSDKDKVNYYQNSFLIGVFLSLAILTRFIGFILLPPVFLYILFQRNAIRQKSIGLILLILPICFAFFINLCINKIIRGSYFSAGYSDSGFTTPLIPGLYGILLSVGRGLFIYNPLAIFGVIFFLKFIKEHQRFGLLTLAAIIIWIVFHAKFFMWWAGWTYGSRFLDPIIPFIYFPIGLFLLDYHNQKSHTKIIFVILLVYSICFQVTAAMINPMEYNNDLWGFLKSENEYLFIPQTSSLFGMSTLIADRRITPAIIETFGKPVWLIVFVIFAIAVFTLLFSARQLCIYFEVSFSKVWKSIKNLISICEKYQLQSILIVIFILIASLSVIFKGERGLSGEKSVLEKGVNKKMPVIEKRLRITEPANHLANTKYSLSGYLDLPIPGKYTFYLKAYGNYKIQIGDKIQFFNNIEKPQHLDIKSQELERGNIPFSLEFTPHEKVYGLLYLYWSMPGNGVYMEPINSEYLFPDELSISQKIFSMIWRNLWALFFAAFLPFILFLSFVKKRI